MRRGYCRRPSKKLRSNNSYNRMAADRKEAKSILGEEKKSENKTEVGNTEDNRTLSYPMWSEYMVRL